MKAAQDFINENKELIVVRFEKNTTIYNNSQIMVAETLPCNFNVAYDENGYFSLLQPIFSICENKLVVNQTMSKKIMNETMFNNNIVTEITKLDEFYLRQLNYLWFQILISSLLLD